MQHPSLVVLACHCVGALRRLDYGSARTGSPSFTVVANITSVGLDREGYCIYIETLRSIYAYMCRQSAVALLHVAVCRRAL